MVAEPSYEHGLVLSDAMDKSWINALLQNKLAEQRAKSRQAQYVARRDELRAHKDKANKKRRGENYTLQYNRYIDQLLQQAEHLKSNGQPVPAEMKAMIDFAAQLSPGQSSGFRERYMAGEGILPILNAELRRYQQEREQQDAFDAEMRSSSAPPPTDDSRVSQTPVTETLGNNATAATTPRRGRQGEGGGGTPLIKKVNLQRIVFGDIVPKGHTRDRETNEVRPIAAGEKPVLSELMSRKIVNWWEGHSSGKGYVSRGPRSTTRIARLKQRAEEDAERVRALAASKSGGQGPG